MINTVIDLLQSNNLFIKDSAERIQTAMIGLGYWATPQDKASNLRLFGDTYGNAYNDSFLNPDYAGYKDGNKTGVLSAIAALCQSAVSDAVLGDKTAVHAKRDFLLHIAHALKTGADEQALSVLFKIYGQQHLQVQLYKEVEDQTLTGKQNKYENILSKSNARGLDWIYEYGQYILPQELEMAKFYFAYDQEKLKKMGERIASAFMHGFISQSRDRRDRQGVRLYYQIGQEALAKQVVVALARRGLKAMIAKPQSSITEEQLAVDHQMDYRFKWDEQMVEQTQTMYSKASKTHKKALMDTCGMIDIGQFGSIPKALKKAKNAVKLTSLAQKMQADIMTIKRDIESAYLNPSDLSFCKVAFPNKAIGEQFKEVFEEVMAFNMVESEPYELVQQTMIDALDRCEYVKILGRYANKTDLTVQFRALSNPSKQTNFLNCGGDLNIPHGEIFTTPKLKGSTGLYHVTKVYLQGKVYHQLRLTFKDGVLTAYSCQNFEDESKNKQYMEDNLLFPNKALTIGEWAIGTNTMAHRVFTTYDLFDKLPILLAEKVGPHLALGDPCFARGEEAPVYNLYDKKEMVARENERTCKRNEKSVYFNKHVDITIAYQEIGEITGYTASGKKVTIMKDGKFVLSGTETLNVALIEH